MKKGINYLAYIRKYEILLASAAVLLLVVILFFNMLLPNLNRANQIHAESGRLSKKVESLKKKDVTLSSLDYQAYRDLFLKLNQVLPEGKDYVSLINTFSLLEQKSGVTVVRTDFQLGVVSTSSANFTRAAGSSAFVIPISIELVGDFSAIRKFLEEVANLAGRLMIFDDMAVTIKSDGTLDTTFTGQAFFYPLPTSLAAIDAPLPRLEKSAELILKNISERELPSESMVELDKASIGKKNLFE